MRLIVEQAIDEIITDLLCFEFTERFSQSQ